MRRERRWDEAANLGGLGEALVKRIRSASVEVKVDQWAASSGWLFVECESWSRTAQRYEPSGIATSQAEFWAFVIGGEPRDDTPGDIVIVRPRHRLIRLCHGCEVIDANKGGENPTRGYRIPLESVLPTGVPQYRQIPCPNCGNQAFRFAGRWSDDGGWWLEDVSGMRECHGPRGCGHVWDAGQAGREIVAWRRLR